MIDFHQIAGPKSSKEDNFQELCAELVLRECPEAKALEGRGGDAGLDVYKGISPSRPEVVWQAKLFYNTLRQAQKRQIQKSFERVSSKGSLTKWILCLPRNLNPSEEEWLQSLVRPPGRLTGRYPIIFLDWWGETKLRELLCKYPDIALQFFPALQEQPPETSLIVHSLSADGSDIEFMLSNLSNNVLVVYAIYLEVLDRKPFNVSPGIGVRILTYRYEVELKPKYIGQYLITNDEFGYPRGEVDKFAILCKSPPGNKYKVRLKFCCSDVYSKKRFPVYSDSFNIWFYKKGGRSTRRKLVIIE